ncbi:Crp/Fnr family transcriptional regulator [Methylobacterium sp. P31]
MPRSQYRGRNRLLAAMGGEDYAALEPALEPLVLNPGEMLIEAHSPIRNVYFLESGVASIVANASEGSIEVGLIGYEGMAGLPVVLGTDRTPYSHIVQGTGEALRISTRALRAAIADRPTIFRPLGLYAVAVNVQVAQTAYANASFNVEERLARWILMTQDRSDGEQLLLTHQFLSIMLGVRRPSVTSATHMLEGMGAIRARRGRITVLDRERLIEVAGDSYQVAEAEYERLMAEAQPHGSEIRTRDRQAEFDCAERSGG